MHHTHAYLQNLDRFTDTMGFLQDCLSAHGAGNTRSLRLRLPAPEPAGELVIAAQGAAPRARRLRRPPLPRGRHAAGVPARRKRHAAVARARHRAEHPGRRRLLLGRLGQDPAEGARVPRRGLQDRGGGRVGDGRVQEGAEDHGERDGRGQVLMP